MARHPKYLLEVLTASEFQDWKAYFYSTPFGIDQVIWMMAQQHADWLNAHTPEGGIRTEPHQLMPTSDLESRWEIIESELEAQREAALQQREDAKRLAGMTSQQRDAELLKRFKQQHAARMGRTVEEDD